jgi:heterodisulfide reductase subunit A-like polyferredoxin
MKIELIINFRLIEYMWLHIRAVGEWTNSLYSYFEKEQQKLHRGDVLAIENTRKTP